MEDCIQEILNLGPDTDEYSLNFLELDFGSWLKESELHTIKMWLKFAWKFWFIIFVELPWNNPKPQDIQRNRAR